MCQQQAGRSDPRGVSGQSNSFLFSVPVNASPPGVRHLQTRKEICSEGENAEFGGSGVKPSQLQILSHGPYWKNSDTTAL